MHILDFIPFVKHFHSFAYWFAFSVAMLETFIGIGLLIPGSTLIVLLGGLAAEGYFDIGDLIFFVIAGAVIGDAINYLLGRKYGKRLTQKEHFFIKPSMIDKSTNFFKKYGGKSVFICRFIPSLRETIPLIAGLSQMNKKQFFLWNFMGAFFWGISLSLSGYFFNSYLKISKLVLTRSGIFILTILLVILLFKSLDKFIIRKGNQIAMVVKSIFHSINGALLENEYIDRFIKKHQKIFNFIAERLNKKSFWGLPFTLFLIILLYVSALLGGNIEDLIKSETIVFADVRIENLLNYFRNDFYNTLFLWITLLGKIEIVSVLSLVTVGLLWIWDRRVYIVPFLGGLLGSLALSSLGKIVFHRPRPAVALYLEPTYSFPSGHATVAVMLYGFIAYVLIKNIEKWRMKVNVFFTALIVMLLIGFSRLYLGVHYASDVWGGYLVGSIGLIVSVGYSEYLCSCKIEKPPVIGKNMLNSYLLVGIFFVSYLLMGINYNPPKIPVAKERFITVKNPLEIFKNENMKFTESILGIKQEPISFIITAKNDGDLISLFERAGWFLADDISALTFLKAAKAVMFSSPYPKAPMTPDFWNAKLNNFGFEKPTEINSIKKRHHSRFWKTGFMTVDGQYIYIGTASLDENLKWAVTHKINPNIDGERSFLLNDLSKSGRLKEYKNQQFINPEIGKNFLGDLFFTDGKVIIVDTK